MTAAAPVIEDGKISDGNLSPCTAQYVKMRMQQEMLAIDREHDRLTKAMNDEILHMKQRLLYDICGKLQDIAAADESNAAKYREMCPDLFVRFTQKATRKRMRKKPKLQKIPLTMAGLDQPIDPNEVIFDLAGLSSTNDTWYESYEGSAIMTTEGGQKWIVKVNKFGDNLHKIEYCDGSSSLVSDSDLKTLNLRFQPFDKL